MQQSPRPEAFTVGQHALVLVESWAGRTPHRVVILKICPKRLLVQWNDPTWGRWATGKTYYVPRDAVRVHDPKAYAIVE